jgi:putative hydrolase of the HAD superfamily
MKQMQINPSQIKMVFFDVGGTLLDVAEPVGNTYAMYAQQYGKQVDPERLQENFLTAFQQMPPLAFGENFAEEVLLKAEYDWWFQLVSMVFSKFGEFRKFPEFFAKVFLHYKQPTSWKLYDDVIPALEKLQERSIKIGIISNFDSRLFSLLDGFELRKYFASIHISSEVGFAKPDQKIFQIALQLNNISPKQAVHIGDSFIEDYEAAIKSGLWAWQIDRKKNTHGLSSFLESLGAS